MIQDEPITPQEMLAELSPSVPAFSVTGVIGGKLRALYDDATQPSPTCLTEFLRALDSDQVALTGNTLQDELLGNSHHKG